MEWFLRFAGPNVIVDIGKTEAIMPPKNKFQMKNIILNQRLTVFISGNKRRS
jgi:hypothetical protein